MRRSGHVRRLKRMYAELALENEAIKGLLKKL